VTATDAFGLSGGVDGGVDGVVLDVKQLQADQVDHLQKEHTSYIS
jgi:hypothetical protein